MSDKLKGAAEMTSDRLKGAMENKVVETGAGAAGKVIGTVVGGQIGLGEQGGKAGELVVKKGMRALKEFLSDKEAEAPPSNCVTEQDPPLRGFIDKHKDKIDKAKDMTGNVLANPEIMEKYRKLLEDTSLESLKKAIEDITTGTFVVTEVFVNEIIRNYAPALSVTFNDGHFVLNTPYHVKPERKGLNMAFRDCNICNGRGYLNEVCSVCNGSPFRYVNNEGCLT